MPNDIKAPQEIICLLDSVEQILKEKFNDNIVGIYLHGSLAFGCFNPVSSDVDLEVVTKSALTDSDKSDIPLLLKIPLEVIPSKKLSIGFVELDVLKNFQHPSVQAFHVSGTGADGFSIENELVSESMTTHIRTIKDRGIVLYGEPAENVFPTISQSDYLTSIISNFEWCYNNVSKGDDVGECKVPNYATLNFCRVLAFIKDGTVTSKVEGGEWGIEHLPPEFSHLIRQALNEYTKTGSSKLVDCANLKNFALYTKEEILVNNSEK